MYLYLAIALVHAAIRSPDKLGKYVTRRHDKLPELEGSKGWGSYFGISAFSSRFRAAIGAASSDSSSSSASSSEDEGECDEEKTKNEDEAAEATRTTTGGGGGGGGSSSGRGGCGQSGAEVTVVHADAAEGDARGGTGGGEGEQRLGAEAVEEQSSSGTPLALRYTHTLCAHPMCMPCVYPSCVCLTGIPWMPDICILYAALSTRVIRIHMYV